MSQVPRWFDRAFALSYPVEMLPNLCARLRGTPARLEEAVGELPHEILVARPRGGWSAQEQAGHLLDLESLWLARVDDFSAGGTQLTPADLTNRKTDDANHNARPLDEILFAFRAAREELLLRVDALDAAVLTRSMLHPRLKQPMTVADHLHFVAEHDDHHLACIWELVNADRA